MSKQTYIAAFRAFRLAMRVPLLSSMDACAIHVQAASHWRSLTNRWDLPRAVHASEWRRPICATGTGKSYWRSFYKPAKYEPCLSFRRLMAKGIV